MDLEINKELIKQVAKNSHLSLTDDEISSFEQDFKDVLTNFSKLQEVDVDNVKPSFHPVSTKNKIREDIVEKSLSKEEIFKNVDFEKNKYIKGPKVV